MQHTKSSHTRAPRPVVSVRNCDSLAQTAARPTELAATLAAFLSPDNPRTEDANVTRCIEALADLDETRHVGRDRRPRHRPLGQLLNSGNYDKLSHALVLVNAVSVALARLELWLASRDEADRPDSASLAEGVVRVLRAAEF